MLARWLDERGEWFEAEAVCREALATHENLLEWGHPDLVQAREHLARVLNNLGRAEEAECLLLGAGIAPQIESSANAP